MFNFVKIFRMKKITLLLIVCALVLSSCKKDHVDGSSPMAFQSSVNDMASSLTTLEQIKFNEALYILKTFGVEAEGDQNELNALAKLLEGKKVPEILALADQVANKNAISWSSTAPPSLGEMNIFGDAVAKEHDANDVRANSLNINVNPTGDNGSGATGLQIVPRLVDNKNENIAFTEAGLETTLEVFSGGSRIYSAKNLMSDNNFPGFNIRFSSIPAQKVVDNKIDITISVKTTVKTFKMTKVGVDINPSALKMPEPPKVDSLSVNPQDPAINPDGTPIKPADTKPVADPKTTVNKFLGNLNSQNLKAAFESSDNPSWGSYETFSSPNSGFGTVKNLTVKNISTKSVTPTSASVSATYDVVDKQGKTTALMVTFGLKNVNGEWKISSYKINP